ncbi:MAG TPA: pyridoxamine 5'-phosphate oxidase family protein [Egibacteraceae bacterium]|nr:pyridoxamine 5'-phosphate oxidase family protein [Egibacteraceae bacterium]
MTAHPRIGLAYHPGQRALQDRFDSRRMADRINDLLVHDGLDDNQRTFIERRECFFLATVDPDGQPTCSYKGGDPGFVRTLDPRTLAFPSYDGNGTFLSLGNLMAHARVGLLFVDFDSGTRLRVHGTASVDIADPLLDTWPEAQAVVRVVVTQVFPNCPRYVHRYALVEASVFVPRAHTTTPVPAWKRAPWARDALPAHDPASHPAGREVRGR